MRKFWTRMAAFARVCAVGLLAVGMLVAALLVWQPRTLIYGAYVLAVLGVLAICATLTMGAVQMLRK